MQICGKHSSSDNMWWDPSAAAIGSCSSSNHTSCGHRMRCRKGDTPAAAGSFKGHSHVVNAARERHAAHCLTCRDKMDRGLSLYKPARMQEGRVAGERAAKAALKLDGVFLRCRGTVRSLRSSCSGLEDAAGDVLSMATIA
jgi:hypothetical protein